MNINEFYEKLLQILPFKEKELAFPERLRKCLKYYESWVSELTFEEEPLEKETLKTISHICKKLNDIVKSSMRGIPSKAFSQLNNMLIENKKDRNFPKIDIRTTILSTERDTNFYRIRQLSSIYDVPLKELFHIPINQRGIIKTQRFSSPGYPCLYIGESIYGCWEEMRRPPMHLCAVARFRSEDSLNFIDLTIPSKEKLRNPSYLILLPLIAACMIRVSDDEATYKPEYIVPQLLIEWILKHRIYEDNGVKKAIHGIAYTSTRMNNNEFNFPTKKFKNYAIPVFNVDSRLHYCSTLCRLFELTRPTTNDIEKLKQGYDLNFGQLGLNEEQQKDQNYTSSDFGQLEKRLCEFPLDKIKCKD